MPPNQYAPGDTVFAKLKGFPWWPARVEDDKDVPAKILRQKGKTKGPLYTVFFYGSRDYGFFGPDLIRPFDRTSVERDLKAKKFKTKDLETAVNQALDPSLLKAKEEAEAAEDKEEEEEEEEKPKKKGRGKNVQESKKKKINTTKKKVLKKKPIEDEEDGRKNKENVRNKRTVNDDIDNDRKKRVMRRTDNGRKSLSTDQDDSRESPLIRKSEEPSHNGHIDKSEGLELFKKTPEYKRIYFIRHKLQKLVYEKEAGQIPLDDYAKISQVIKEIEDSKMTFDLLRYTKLGKVVKFACFYNFEGDEFKLNQRCQQLMKNWKSLVVGEPSRLAVEQQEQHEN
ncbi:hypothetical protein BDB01DRAFT_728615 [Pilobolus umbonatus]|nr:hypothetical protein BDB01DRAFT_728615 [Pilobolus umbonatus]